MTEADAYTYVVEVAGLKGLQTVTANNKAEAWNKAALKFGRSNVRRLSMQVPEVMDCQDEGQPCSVCGSRGFEPSSSGKGCTFCDGSFSGNPPGIDPPDITATKALVQEALGDGSPETVFTEFQFLGPPRRIDRALH